jgi:putative transposase
LNVGAIAKSFARDRDAASRRLCAAEGVEEGKGGGGVDPIRWTPEHWGRQAPDEESTCRGADARLSTTIHLIHAGSRGTYGAPRVHAELAHDHDVHCGRKRVARLMRIAGLRGVCRRRHMRTTRRDELAHRQFHAREPNRLWVADVTYLPTWQGFLYLASYLRTELVLDALEMALWNRRPEPGLVHHTDHGSQTGLKESSQQGHRELRCESAGGERRIGHSERECGHQVVHRSRVEKIGNVSGQPSPRV